MTFDTARATLGRKPVLLCDLGLDRCSNTYGATVSNLHANPEDFTAWSITQTPVVTADQDTAPDGAVTADTIEDDDAASSEAVYQDEGSLTIASYYCFTVFIKKDEIGRATRFPLIELEYSGSTTEATELKLDTQTGGYTISSASTLGIAGVISEGDYWRVYVSAKSGDAGNTSLRVSIYPAGGASATWALAVTALGTVTAWGAQLTEGDTLHLYAAATCSATGGAGDECYNTRATCQDLANYAALVPKWCTFSTALVEGQPFIPCISPSELAPTVINPSKGLGQRASIRVRLDDFPHNDIGVDPYHATRTYTPADQGEYFAKLIARNKHYAGRPLKIRSGYWADGAFSRADFQTRNYVIDNINGPNDRGQVTITAKDILKLADDKRAQCPATTTGKLVGALTTSSSSLTVTSGTESEYTAEGDYLRIGDEIIRAPTGNRSSNVFSNLTRGAFGTEAAEHAIDDTVQSCKRLNATNVIDLIEDLLTNYAGISSTYINATDWADEESNWYATSDITTLITEPTGVTELLNDLAEQYFLQLWWNEIDQEILLKAIVPPTPGATIPTWTDEGELIEGKTAVTRADEKRLTRVLFYYNPRSPIDVTEPEDYESAYITIDGDAEAGEEYGDARLKVIYGRFVDSESIAVQTGGRLLNRFKNVPQEIVVNVDAKDAGAWTGDLVVVDSRRLQGHTGANAQTQFQVMSVKEKTNRIPGSVYEYKMLENTFAGRYGYIGPDTLTTYPLESDANVAAYGFISPDSAVFTDGEPAYRMI